VANQTGAPADGEQGSPGEISTARTRPMNKTVIVISSLMEIANAQVEGQVCLLGSCSSSDI
jgi:hypothetical protein